MKQVFTPEQERRIKELAVEAVRLHLEEVAYHVPPEKYPIAESQHVLHEPLPVPEQSAPHR